MYESNSTIGAKNLLIVVAVFFHQKKLEIQKAHTLHYLLSALLCATCVVCSSSRGGSGSSSRGKQVGRRLGR